MVVEVSSGEPDHDAGGLTRIAAGEPLIDFHAHVVRGGTEGARAEFEQMLGLLVRLDNPTARVTEGAGGDWGIDVFAGDLRGDIEIWQAKFFIGNFQAAQWNQVGE